jgi:hypothetical protein
VLLVNPERYQLTTKANLSLDRKSRVFEQQLAPCFDLKHSMPAATNLTVNDWTDSIGLVPCNRYVIKLRLALQKRPLKGKSSWLIKQDIRKAMEEVIRDEVNELFQMMSQPLDTIELGL